MVACVHPPPPLEKISPIFSRGGGGCTQARQMAIATALLRFDDLGCSVTPTFLFRNRFYSQLSPHCPKMNKNQCGKLKKFRVFCPRDMESCHRAAARRMKLWSLNANLFFKEPKQLTKFT